MRRRSQLAWALCIAAGSATIPGARAQTVSFAAAPSFSAGTSPTSVAAGDFNGDNRPDLAVTNQNGVSILINDGNGGFQPRVDYTYPAATNTQCVIAGNFNADGKLDLAVVNQGAGTVTILLGAGDGTFQVGLTYPAGSNPRRVVVADFNGDKIQDLAVVDSGAAPGTSGVSILLGNGDGTFQAARFSAAGSTSLSVDTGDFDHDGKVDLAVANSGSDDVSVLLGNGNGTFQPAVSYNLNQPGISVSPTSVTIADFNLDGHQDLAVATPNVKGYAVLLGLGNGTFQAPVHYTLDDPNFVNNNNVLIAADMNADTKADLVLVNYSGNHVTILIGAGDGTFPSSYFYAAGPEPVFVAMADFNGDTIPDLAVSDNAIDGVVTLMLGAGGGALQAAPLYRSAYTPQSLAVGDLNSDGLLDLVAAAPGGANGIGSGVTMLGNADHFVVGKGDGTFKPPVTWTTSVVTSIALGDFDRDGKLDLVSTTPAPGGGNVAVWLGKGDGTFQSPKTMSAGTAPDTVAVADLNGDKKLDLVVGNRDSGNVSVLLGNGDGTFQAAVNYSTPAAGTPDSVVITDFDGDGKLDIAAAISGINATSVALLLGNGDGSFRTAIPMPSGFHSPGTLRIAAGDFNNDGKFDLAVTDGAMLSVLMGNGTGAIPTPITYPLVGAGAAINGMVVVVDFNGDAIADLAATSRDGISVLLGTGNGTFQPAANYYPFLGGAIAVGDFNGDNRQDMVAADSGQDATTTDTLASLLNTTAAHTAPLTVATSPTGLSVDVYYGFPPGGVLSEYTTCGAAPCVYNAAWGNFFQIYARPSIAGSPGTQYILDSFSDDGPSINDCCGQIIHAVAFTGVPFTETVKYRSQYQVTVVVSPAIGGTAAPASGTYIDANASVSLTATASSGYTFSQWSSSPGGVVCHVSACSAPVLQPVTWTANFTFTGQRCDLNTDGQLNVVDVQRVINQALGVSPPLADLNRDGNVNVSDIQLLINAVLGTGACPQ